MVVPAQGQPKACTEGRENSFKMNHRNPVGTVQYLKRMGQKPPATLAVPRLNPSPEQAAAGPGSSRSSAGP